MIEPLPLDEAYFGVTNDKQNIGSAIEIAKLVRKASKEELNLTNSAEVSVNKFVAKIASDIKKPDGLTFIEPSKIESFMEKLPVEKFYGLKNDCRENKDDGLAHQSNALAKQADSFTRLYLAKTIAKCNHIAKQNRWERKTRFQLTSRLLVK